MGNKKSKVALQNATVVMDTLDTAGDFDNIAHLVAKDAPFMCQADALKDISTVERYMEWMTGFATNIAPGCSYKIHCTSCDEGTEMVSSFRTFTAKHTGEAGPVPATNKETNTDYCYIVKMDDDHKVESLTKVWNDGNAFKDLGWAP
jgi:hypothetical protein